MTVMSPPCSTSCKHRARSLGVVSEQLRAVLCWPTRAASHDSWVRRVNSSSRAAVCDELRHCCYTLPSTSSESADGVIDRVVRQLWSKFTLLWLTYAVVGTSRITSASRVRWATQFVRGPRPLSVTMDTTSADAAATAPTKMVQSGVSGTLQYLNPDYMPPSVSSTLQMSFS